MAADTYDLISLTEARAVLNVQTADTTQDAEIERIVSAVSQRIVDLCGEVVARTYTDEAYDGGDGYLMLRNAPISLLATTTVSAVKEYDTTGTLTTLSLEDFDTKPADGYLFIAEEGMIYRRSSGGAARFVSGMRNVLVTYTAGRAADTSAVPRKFKHAAEQWLRLLFIPTQGAATATFGGGALGVSVPTVEVPNVVVGILGSEIKHRVAAG